MLTQIYLILSAHTLLGILNQILFGGLDINQGLFCHWGRGAEDPPRRNASYLGGKELEPLFAHCTHHYSFPLQKINIEHCI